MVFVGGATVTSKPVLSTTTKQTRVGILFIHLVEKDKRLTEYTSHLHPRLAELCLLVTFETEREEGEISTWLDVFDRLFYSFVGSCPDEA